MAGEPEETAIDRLRYALDRLEGALDRRARRDQLRADADAEFQMMQDDRARLAVELDAALDAQRTLADANNAAMERIGSAAKTIERLLGRSSS